MNSILNRESLRVEIITLDDNTKGIFIPLETAAKIFNLLPSSNLEMASIETNGEPAINLSDCFISFAETFISSPYELYKTSRYIGIRSKPSNSNIRKKTGLYIIYNSNKKELSLSVHKDSEVTNIISQFEWITDVIAEDNQNPQQARMSMEHCDLPKHLIVDQFSGYIPSYKREVFKNHLANYIKEQSCEVSEYFYWYLREHNFSSALEDKDNREIRLPSSLSITWWQGKQENQEKYESYIFQMRYDGADFYPANCYESWVESPYLDYQPFFQKMVAEEIIYPVDTDARFQGTYRLIFRNSIDVENFFDDIQDGLNKFFAEAS